jgi:hypothetical protein
VTSLARGASRGFPDTQTAPHPHCLCYRPFKGDGAGDETRTRDIQLGRLALYQLSYSRVVPLSGGAISCRAVLLSTASPPESVPRPVYMGSAAAAAGALVLLGLFAWGLAQSIQIAKLEQRHESAIGPSGVRMEAATRPSTTPMTPKPASPAERSRGEPLRRLGFKGWSQHPSREVLPCSQAGWVVPDG